MDLKNFETQIKKTGFPLEDGVSSLLRSSGWTVINNRYYVDDQEESVREIDLVAYKARPVQHFNVFTTIIISCKKSEPNVWALLARKKEHFDPNLDTRPMHIWTNDKALSFMFSKADWARDYYRRAQEEGVQNVLSEPCVQVFAFQEMNRESGSPQNDRPIFSSITSLMKAQSYEMDALPRRKKNPSVYQFNLASIVDTQLIQLYFKGSGPRATEIDEEHYLARYIINKRDTFARIHFIRADRFEKALSDYDRLHSANCEIFSSVCDEFYDNVLGDSKRAQVFADEFDKRLKQHLWFRILRAGINEDKIDSIWPHWNKKDSRVDVMITASEKAVRLLNSDEPAKEYVRNALADLYRYSGSFSFVEDVPF